MRLKPISARLAALSISSRQSRMTSGLRRVSTPPAPMQNTNAETTMNQVMLMSESPAGHLHRLALGALALGLQRRRADVAAGGLGHRARADRREQVADADPPSIVQRRDAPAAAREHDRADGGDEQQDRRGLEGEEELGQQQRADVARRAEGVRAGRVAGALGVERLEPAAEHGDADLDQERPREEEGQRLAAAPGRAAE